MPPDDTLDTLLAREMSAGEPETPETSPPESGAEEGEEEELLLAEESAEDEDEADAKEDEDEKGEDAVEDDEAEEETPTKVLSQEELDDLLITVKVDGKEEKVKVREARQGYQRAQDYTRKTMELAERRKALEAQTEQYAQLIPVLQERLTALAETAKLPDPALRESDPGEYAAQMADYNAVQEQKRAVEAEAARLKQENAEKTAAAFAEHVRNEMEVLAQKLPAWKDPETAAKEQKLIRRFMLANGYSESEIDMLSDHRAVLLVRKALLYDQQKAKARTKVRPVSERPGPPPKSKTAVKSTSRLKKLDARAAKGDKDAFADLLVESGIV